MQGSGKQGAKDREILKFQLKRNSLKPILKIAKRCKEGFPQVIMNFPLEINNKGEIWFPTLFWLTCPYLHYQISKLENSGFIKRLETLILDKPFYRVLFLQDQKRCMDIREERFSYLRIHDSNGLRFFKRGIGGVSNMYKVKCLHLHYAFFLATGGGFVGKIVFDELVKRGINPLFCSKDFDKYCGRRNTD